MRLTDTHINQFVKKTQFSFIQNRGRLTLSVLQFLRLLQLLDLCPDTTEGIAKLLRAKLTLGDQLICATCNYDERNLSQIVFRRRRRRYRKFSLLFEMSRSFRPPLHQDNSHIWGVVSHQTNQFIGSTERRIVFCKACSHDHVVIIVIWNSILYRTFSPVPKK